MTASADATGELKTYALEITAEDVRLTNESAVSAQADARGLAVGAIAIGASVATAQMRANLDTVVRATITAADIDLSTQFRLGNFANAAAYSQSTSGGILAGNGAVSSAWGNYTVAADYAGLYTARNATTIRTSAAAVKLLADTTGAQGGIFALGKTLAQAGQNQNASLGDEEKLGAVDLALNNAVFRGKALVIDTSNTPDISVDATAGSGGLFAGSASEAFVTVATRTTSIIGAGGPVVIDDMESVSISTGQVTTLASKVDTISAAALGVSGAIAIADISSTVATTLGGNVAITAETIEISALNAVSRPEDGFNITSGSGGIFDGAAINSVITVDATTDVAIGDGAMILQTGLADNDQRFTLGARTNMALVDRVNLDAGGAIAIPRGQSEIDIASNSATVTIGAAKLFSVDEMRIYSGGDASIRAEVNANSYGLAGAATGSSKVSYTADNRIVLRDGADLESLRDVRVTAGYNALGAQNVTLNAETRLFNKTAIPIPSDPAADALASTVSRIDVQEGARVLAVRDVYLFAEPGAREIAGYGRGKDLYREVLAELGTAISEAFGGEAVSLDIESGSATNTADNGVIVNGYVRAGARNKQVLVLDADNTLNNARANNGDQVYTDDMVSGITYNIRRNVSIASDVLERVALLDSLLADPTLTSDAAAVDAWEAERSVLLLRDVTGRADFIDLEDIVASEGNIVLRSDYVHGTATGTLDAPGNAEIIVQVYSDAFINTKAMDIPENAGGRITFNDVVVTTPQAIVALSDPTRSGVTDYEMISGEDAGLPKIEVVTFGEGSIIVGGAISNTDGLALFNSNQGDLDVRADISARTIDLRAGRDFLLGSTTGIYNVDGDPESIYEDYFKRVQDLLRNATGLFPGAFFNAGEDVVYTEDLAIVGPVSFNVGTVPDFVAVPRRGRIQGGRNVYITADKLNINGLIQAGRGSFNIEIGSAIDTYLDTLVGSSGIVTLYDPSEPFTTDSATGISNLIRNANIDSDVFVRFDPTATNDKGEVTGAILVTPMVVQGGVVKIKGQIFSTGGGEIRSLDGFGTINVLNESRRPIKLGRLDTGSATPAGVEGVVRITDTTFRTSTTPALITEYRRTGSVLEVRNNVTFNEIEIDFNDDGIIDLVEIEPTNLVRRTSALDGRSGIYTPKQRQELVINQAETVTSVSNNTQTERYFVFKTGEKQKVTIKTTVAELEPTVLPGRKGTYLAIADTDLTSPYRVSAELVTSLSSRTDDVVNDKRILGIGDVVTTWSVTRSSTLLYSHRLKADHAVLISFDGTDVGGLDVVSTGDILLSGPVRNEFGTTSLSSSGGSLLTADTTVVVNIGEASLEALGGRIDGTGSEFRLDQTAGSTLSAQARDSINLREMDGDMQVSAITTTARGGAATNLLVGQVRLMADGSIIGVGTGPHVTGASLDLTAITGTIGTTTATLIITEEGGTLTALANGDINIRQRSGDLRVRDVRSSTGDVTLAVPAGSILDRNDVETRDLRTEAELAELWSTDLGLFGDAETTARAAAQVAALQTERERSYRDYWNARDAAGGAPLDFVLDAATAQVLRDGGWSDARIDAYVAERQALYDLWNADAARIDGYTYTISLEERTSLLDGATWTPQQLQEFIRAGLIRGTGDTNPRIEDPNIRAAGDMTLNTQENVGELLPDFILGTDRVENLRVLSAAERGDITIDNGTGTVSVARRENLNIEFTATNADGKPLGSLTVPSVNGDIFIASEAAVDIRQLTAEGDVFFQIDGAITDSSTAGTAAITGLNMVLESGNTAPMGTVTAPLSLNILNGGSLIARSGGGLYLETLGDAPLAELFSGGALMLDAAGQITDVVATGAVRVRAADITLAGASIGSNATPIVMELTGASAGVDLVTRTGDAFVAAQGAMNLRNADIFGGGTLSTTQQLGLTGTNILRFGTTDTLRLVTPGGIDTTASSGTDITGGALILQAGGAVGLSTKRLTTALTSFDFAATGSAATPLFISESDDLVIGTITQTQAGSDTDIIAGGVLTVGGITSPADVSLDAKAIATARIIAERTQLLADTGLGTTTRLDITTGALQALSTTGDIRIDLRDRDVNVEEVQTGGDGSIDLTSANAAVTLLAGNGISTAGGTITGLLTQLVAGADITSSGGEITLTTAQALTLLSDRRIDSGAGRLSLNVENDLLSLGAGSSLQSGDDMTVTAGTLTMDADGLIDSGTGDLTLTSAGNLTLGARAQVLSEAAALSVTADMITLADTVVLNSSGGTLAMHSANALEMAADVRVQSRGGDMTIRSGAITQGARGLIDSGGGVLVVSSAGELLQTASAEITSGEGSLTVSVGGNMQIARIATTNATRDALKLDVAGTLDVASGQEPVQIVANSTGALSVLRLGQLLPSGLTGLKVALATLDVETVRGDIHLNEADGIILQSVVARSGLIDIFSAGRTEIHSIRTVLASPIVLTTSVGDMVADNAVIAGGDTRIFALEGALTGITSDTFRADTLDGTTLHLFAGSDLRYAETAGDVRVGFALADQGDLIIEAQDGRQSIGVLGANGAMTLVARDSLRVSMIGETSVDLADEVALSLVNPMVYGFREARSPRDVDLLTQTDEGEIFVGLVGVQDSLDLVGDRINLLAHDVNPANGLLMTVMDASGGLADRVDIASVGVGAKLFIADGDYFADPRPRLTDRGRTDGASGALTLTRGYIGTGDISHAGPVFVGGDIRIGGDVWFRQRDFDLLATTQYAALSTVADTQALAFFGGKMTFDITDDIVLNTIAQGQTIDGSGGTVLVLNRRLGGIDLNGGQGYAFGTGVDTDILGFPVTFQDGDGGVTTPLVIRKMMDQYETGTTLLLNGFLTQEVCSGEGRCPDISAIR